MNHPRRFGICLVIVALCGCQTLSEGLREPSVTLTNVSLGEISSNSQAFVLDFVVSNPNDIPLPVRAINYGVSLGGASLLSGATTDAFRVPANGDGTFSVSVETSLLDVARMLGTRLLRGGETSLDYRVGGDVEVDIPFVKPLPFSTEGTIAINR